MSKTQLPGFKSSSPRTIQIALTAITAALYAASIAATAYIPTPWAIGHLRPGVFIPAFFTVACGPIIGGLGAAIGCFLGDFALSYFGYTNPLLSLLAGVPANFVGFYILGWLTRKFKTWSAFIANSFIALLIGNLIAATGVVVFGPIVIPAISNWMQWSLTVKIATIMGFTIFWLVTMIPFVVWLTPILVERLKPTIQRTGINPTLNEISWGKPQTIIKSGFTTTILLLLIFLICQFTPIGSALYEKCFTQEIILLLNLLPLIAAIFVAVFSIILYFYVKGREAQVG